MAFVISTVPNIGNETLFYDIELVTSCVFLVEYILRILVAPEDPKYSDWSCTMARLHYLLTWQALVDAAATFPFFIEAILGYNMPTLTWLRLLRIFRILKTEKAARALSSIYRVLWYNGEILSVGVLVGMLLNFFTALLLYYLRPSDDDDDGQFESMLATLYLSLLMLCGQGEPEGDLPWYTEVVVSLTACFSIAFFAIPASMLSKYCPYS